LNTELRLDVVMKSIDVYGRLAYGGQIVAAMAMLAGPVLFVTCAVLPFVLWDDDRGDALLVWLGGWGVSLALVAGGMAFALFCWRWSGDWITEWPGYAIGIATAALANGVIAWLITSTPVPVYLAVLAVAGGAFAVGLLIAGNLAGTQVLQATRPARALARRR
jgi:hypothetical protein